MLLIETALVLFSLLICFACPSLGSRWFANLEWRSFQLSRHRVLSIIVVGLAALALRAALLPLEGIPQPTIPDEFSYLLMSDTFAHGRLANPTHPMWVHLDAPGVNQRPTYISKYFPGQGIALAFGQKLLGHPFWGVWISVGLMCAAICWMLQGWFPPFWALVGSLLAVIRLGTFSYWANSYFGGAFPALGGALVLGALPRIKRVRSISHSLLMGLGFALLASSRPFEGLIFSLPIVVALLLWLKNLEKAGARGIIARVILSAALVVIGAGVALLYYFWCTTGSPFRTPYQVNIQTQDPLPLFPWQSIRPAAQTDMGSVFSAGLIEHYEFVRSHFFLSTVARAIQFCLFFLGPALALPFVMLVAVRCRLGNVKLLSLVLLISGFGLLLPTYFGPSYAAPLTCVIYALLVAAMQGVRRWRWRNRSTGAAIVRAVPVICCLMFLIRTIAPSFGTHNLKTMPITWCSPHLFEELSRERVQHVLESKPGLHLAIVRYSQDRLQPVDWVQNLADIERQKVVWANDLGTQKNQELIEYFKARNVWLIEPDKPQQITPYYDRAVE